MTNDIVDDGIVRYESNFGVEDGGTVEISSDDARNFMRSSPEIIGALALFFVVECCEQLSENIEERNLFLSYALSHFEGLLKMMKS